MMMMTTERGRLERLTLCCRMHKSDRDTIMERICKTLKVEVVCPVAWTPTCSSPCSLVSHLLHHHIHHITSHHITYHGVRSIRLMHCQVEVVVAWVDSVVWEEWEE